MIVAEAGVIRYEDYYNGHKGKEPLHIYSGTKSFFGVLAVIAEERGRWEVAVAVGQDPELRPGSVVPARLTSAARPVRRRR